MLGFLRRIRRTLLEEGHLRKYLVYAVGEILLIVVGILIALQINNWNEESKSRIEAHQLLRVLKTNTESNIRSLEQTNGVAESVIASIDIVIDNLTDTKVYHDSLRHHFLFSTFFPQSGWEDGAYETLKGKGLDLISSNDLRDEIVGVYEQERQKMLQESSNSSSFANNSLYPAHIKHFRVVDFNIATHEEKAEPIDYDVLAQSSSYLSTISFWRLNLVARNMFRSELISKLEALNVAIADELNER